MQITMILLGLVFTFTGSTAEASTSTPVLVVSGGYNSCTRTREIFSLPHAIQIQFLASKLKTARGKAPNPVVPIYVCFTGLLADTSVDRIDLWISHDKHFRKKEVHTLSSAGIRGEAQLKPLYRFIQKVLAQTPSPRLFALGHSYGGWVAGHVVQHFGGRTPISGLVTLDPISPVDCKPLRMLRAAATLYSPKGCRRAPQDLKVARIAPHVKFWRNVYQRSFYFLHSGPIAGLDDAEDRFGLKLAANVRLKNLSVHAHGNVAGDLQVWRWITKTAVPLW